MSDDHPAAPPLPDSERDRVVRAVLQALRQIRFGSVEIVIHDSRVVQIERREKLRVGGTDARNLD